jgi:hypothetical protein
MDEPTPEQAAQDELFVIAASHEYLGDADTSLLAMLLIGPGPPGAARSPRPRRDSPAEPLGVRGFLHCFGITLKSMYGAPPVEMAGPSM